MEQSKSRLDQELQAWREREQRYQTLFSPSVLKSREFLKEKLKYYDEIRVKAISNPINEDRVAMRAFQVERAQLARQVYPNLFARLIERIVSAFRVSNNVTKVQKETVVNNSDVQLSMQKVGLGAHFNQVQQRMRQGEKEISIPVSYQVREGEKIELELSFKKDDAGKYHFENYRATLHSEQEKVKARQHTFELRQGDSYNLDIAYNLLAGRSVQGADGWRQLDLNDKDGAGNLRVKHFATNYGFDIEKALLEIPVKDMDRSALIGNLKNGRKEEVQLTVNNKTETYFLAADPYKKEIAIYNSTSQKVTTDNFKNQGQANSRNNVRALIPKQKSQRQSQQQPKSKSLKL